ncbi:MAG: cation diffusion facilitator family transporter [Dehalococcoidales bacterium]|jgi:cation diffusion facilitator family transporter|nr:cation diffusion facilitator family transporter [Dehalococcoidales bacterium]MDD5605512.1 cation diffusion facilitator family transporter [Dehalococcoidales bacterium]NLE90855.1 cation transporter [Dehalococcoidales bacterium]
MKEKPLSEKPSFFRSKEGGSIVAIAATATLIVMKIVGSLVTGSIGLRADAIHSIIDLSGAAIGLAGIKIAAKPADKGHAFGHGKAENLAGAIIGVFIFLAACFIAYEAIVRLVSAAQIQMVTAGIYITIGAILINLVVALYVLRIARDTDSAALEATSHDLLADSLSSLGVLVGLGIVAVTDNYIFDVIVALAVSLLIFRTSVITISKSISNLMDRRLPPHEEEMIKKSLENCGDVISFHALRTRKAGSERHIDVHVEVPPEYTVSRAHEICNQLEVQIEDHLPNSHVTIHVEPHGYRV